MIYLLFIISMIQGIPDVQVSTFTSEEQCLREVRVIVQQGSSAYCVPVKKEG
jgi:hypothetical protein